VTSEFKACPFCGSEANRGYHNVFGTRARCSSTGCDACVQWICIGDWNRRAPSPAVARLVEACKAILPHIKPPMIVDHMKFLEALAAVEKEMQS
jgi:hypothetical protein